MIFVHVDFVIGVDDAIPILIDIFDISRLDRLSVQSRNRISGQKITFRVKIGCLVQAVSLVQDIGGHGMAGPVHPWIRMVFLSHLENLVLGIGNSTSYVPMYIPDCLFPGQ